MPKLNGIDVIEKIRKEYKGELITDFVIITADRNLVQKAIQLEVFSVINKPYKNSKIIEVINEYIDFAGYSKEPTLNNTTTNNKQNLFVKLFRKKN